MDHKILKYIGMVAVIIVVINLVLFALKIVEALFFWAVLVLATILAWKVLPQLKK